MSLLSAYSKAQVYTYGALLLAGVALATWLTIWYLVDENDDLSNENVVAVADAQAGAVYIRGAKAQEKEYVKHKEAVDEALKANDDYANQPVPDDVADQLRDPASSK